MDARKKEIDQLGAENARLEHQITAECVSIGKRITELDHQSVRNEELAKYLNNVASLLKTIATYEQDIDRVQTTVRRIRELHQQIQENDQRVREVNREREAKFVDLGAGSYTIFKGLEDRSKYRPYFEDLLRMDVDIERIRQELEELDKEEKSKGFFEKLLVYKGKKVLRRGDINRLEKEKLKAYAEIGRRLSESDFAAMANGDLKSLYERDLEKRREIEKIQKESAQVKGESDRLRVELKRLGIEDQSEDKIGELHKRIGDVRRELDVMHCWTGQLFIERDLRSEVPDATLSTKFDIVAGLRESIRKKQASVFRLKAEMEVEEIQKKEKNLRLRRKQLEEEMRVKERQVGVIDLEIGIGTKRLEELKRVLTGEAPYTEPSSLPPTPDFYTEKKEAKP